MYSPDQAARKAGNETPAWAGAPRPRSTGGIKTYRLHNCGKVHRTGAAMARCIWGGRARIEGQGAYAVVHWLKVGRARSYPDVLLYEDFDEARIKCSKMMEPYYCGGSCRNGGARHELVRLDLENQERQ